ncbi:MAG: V8-like Glu-specific endopeptidase [Bacteriovoracaceae bacterium]|jgi:V8-like Glu-specific endopeptidase
MKTLTILFALFSTIVFAGDDCEGLCGQEFATELNSPLLQSLSTIVKHSGSNFPETMPNDTRKVRGATSPKWLEAVGRLVSTKSSTEKEQCSLTIISNHPSKDGIIAVTAGHCVDHWYYGGNDYRVGANTVTFQSNSGKTITRSIEKVLKSSMSSGDYAIVKLNSPVKKEVIKPLISAPYDYVDLLDEEMFGEKFKPFGTMAGYSADKGLGKKGKVLTYDEKCRLNGGVSGNKKGYCYSYGGASGGPVVVTVDLGEFGEDYGLHGTQHLFVGSIVGGQGVNDNSKTMFTETSHYSSSLDEILEAH